MMSHKATKAWHYHAVVAQEQNLNMSIYFYHFLPFVLSVNLACEACILHFRYISPCKGTAFLGNRQLFFVKISAEMIKSLIYFAIPPKSIIFATKF